MNPFVLMVGGQVLLNQYADDETAYLCVDPSDQDACVKLKRPTWTLSGNAWDLTAIDAGRRVRVLSLVWTSSSEGKATWAGHEMSFVAGNAKGAAVPPAVVSELRGPAGWSVQSGNRVTWQGAAVQGVWLAIEDCVPDNGDLKFFGQLDDLPPMDPRVDYPLITRERDGATVIVPGGVAPGNCSGDVGPKHALLVGG